MLHHRTKARTAQLDQQLLGRDGRSSARRLGQEELVEHGRHHGVEEEEEVAVGGDGKTPERTGRKELSGIIH